MTPTEPRPEQGRRQYCFGEFVLDIESGFLRQGTKERPLQPKAFEVLSYLVERRGRVVSKQELIDAVWRETAVTDNSLSQCIVQIRRALADDSQQLIRTVARRGYVFAAPSTTTIREFPRTVQAPTSEGDSSPVAAPRARYPRSRVMAAVLAIGLAGTVLSTRLLVRKRPEPVYTQITNFADSAAGPALSPDGRMVAFFRSDSGFATTGPIYVKMLPNGEAVQVADDPRTKYGLAFSPDSSQIAYTAWVGDAKFQWQTFTVPVLGGGQPHLLFANAAGLTWLDERRLLYSEIRSGLHMGIVTSSLTRTDRREIYFPKHERRMAHYSYPSPDRKWALVIEMEPEWLPCRIVPMDGSSLGRQVGPRGACTATGWSPDGRWMYFGAEVDGAHHLWRQRFPNGKPEQITFGPTEEEGLAVAPDGHSLITSVGMRKGEVWIHDSQGEHPISPEGYAPANYLVLTEPLFSPDGRHVYYLLRRDSPGSENELWRTNLNTRASECVIRGFSILEFDISGTAQAPGQLVFSSQRHGGPSEIWLAPLDGSAPPKRIAASGEGSPHFGPDGKLWFRYSDGKANYVGLMNQDGSGRRQASPRPISTVMASSPDGHWLVAMAPASDGTGIVTTAIPADIGARPHVIGRGYWPLSWARDGRFVYIGLDNDKNETVMIPVSPGEFPELPDGGIRSPEQVAALRGARLIHAIDIAPGPDPSTFAYVKERTSRNLFRLSLP